MFETDLSSCLIHFCLTFTISLFLAVPVGPTNSWIIPINLYHGLSSLFCFVLFVLVLWRATETYFNLVRTRSPHPSLLWISVTMLFFAFVQQIDYVWQTPASVLFSILKMLHWPLTFILMTSWVQIPSSFSFPRSPVFGNYLPCDIYSWRTSAQGRRCFHLYDLPPGPVE